MGVGASQVSGELLPVWVVEGIATLFLMMKSTTAPREKLHTHKQGSPSTKEVPKNAKIFAYFGQNNTFLTDLTKAVRC